MREPRGRSLRIGLPWCRSLLCSLFALALPLQATQAGFPDPLGELGGLFPGARLERGFDGGYVLTEGVTAGPDCMISFRDITLTRYREDPSRKDAQAGKLAKYNPRLGQSTIFRGPSSGMSNGIKFNHDSNMIAVLGADCGGRIDIYDPRYLDHESIAQDAYAVYRRDPDGGVYRVATDYGRCNGVLMMPDRKTLYIIGNDNGWLEFPNLTPGETSLQGHHQWIELPTHAAVGRGADADLRYLNSGRYRYRIRTQRYGYQLS